MFTTNFFSDNSQLNFGKHISKPREFSGIQKKEMHSVVDSLIIAKIDQRKATQESGRLIFSISLMLSMLLVITAFEWRFENKGAQMDLGDVNSEAEELFEIPPTLQPPPPPPKIRVATIIEVPDIEDIKEEIEVDLDVEILEDTKIEEVVFDAMEDNEDEEVDRIFLIVEKAPEPIGGMSEFYNSLAKNLRYPKEAVRANVSGKVYVEFVVTKSGNLENIRVVKGIGFGCDQEAIRVISKVPNWNPGKQRGKPVNVRMIIPIAFNMRN